MIIICDTVRLKTISLQLENTNEKFDCDGILTSKHAHTYSRRKICSPDAEENAPGLQSVQLTSLVDPEINKNALCRVCTGTLLLVIGWYKTIWVPRIDVYENTLSQTIIADPNLNLSRRFPLDTDCNTQTKKILLENQRAVPVHHLALNQPHPLSIFLESTSNHNPPQSLR